MKHRRGVEGDMGPDFHTLSSALNVKRRENPSGSCWQGAYGRLCSPRSRQTSDPPGAGGRVLVLGDVSCPNNQPCARGSVISSDRGVSLGAKCLNTKS